MFSSCRRVTVFILLFNNTSANIADKKTFALFDSYTTLHRRNESMFLPCYDTLN